MFITSFICLSNSDLHYEGLLISLVGIISIATRNPAAFACDASECGLYFFVLGSYNRRVIITMVIIRSAIGIFNE